MLRRANGARFQLMRYVVVDRNGNQRESFGSRAELVEELTQGEVESPGEARSFWVVTYDDDGDQVGRVERGDEVLAGNLRSAVLVMRQVASAVSASATTRTMDARVRHRLAGARRRSPAGRA
jgi:hypothetical protein